MMWKYVIGVLVIAWLVMFFVIGAVENVFMWAVILGACGMTWDVA